MGKYKPLEDLIHREYLALQKAMADDLVCFGEAAYKTSIESGKPKIEYIEPSVQTLAELEAIERGEFHLERLTFKEFKKRFGLTDEDIKSLTTTSK